jgi:cyclic pyranopterin phosphate synthase
VEGEQNIMNNDTLTDRFGRKHDYLRLSLTDRCNLRCSYCMPARPVYMQYENLLSADQISLLTSSFVSLGIRKIRLTGGEPLLRGDFETIVERIFQQEATLHLTTNGYYLDKYLDTLETYFSSINISLDTLDKKQFSQITQRNAFEHIFQNIELCISKGVKIKLNVVVIRHVNHHEILDFIDLTRNFPLEVRFIEFMPFRGNQWSLENTFTHREILEVAESRHTIDSLYATAHETAQKYRVKGWSGSFGIISTISKPFCSDCNRIRITADGKLKTCLFGLKEYDLKPYLNNPEILKQQIRESLLEKHSAHGGLTPMAMDSENVFYNKNRCMTSIGG